MGILNLIKKPQPQPQLSVQQPRGDVLEAGGVSIPNTYTRRPQSAGWGVRIQNPGSDYQVQPQRSYDQQQPNQVGISYWNLAALSGKLPGLYTGAHPAYNFEGRGGIPLRQPAYPGQGWEHPSIALPLPQPVFSTYNKLQRL